MIVVRSKSRCKLSVRSFSSSRGHGKVCPPHGPWLAEREWLAASRDRASPPLALAQVGVVEPFEKCQNEELLSILTIVGLYWL
jgi:hypothetical protein